MNKRIRQLAEQAGFAYEPSPTLQKFAELIVKECCDQVRMVDAMEIKKHFGVEE